ncbi:cupin domain-containing protein [Leucobacter sp. CSA2]|uniref:Cupin domain-containing protein n=1 Tax=Leucobacter edaphi TaxID=2796472 RepID=A0A934QBU4_9MICO|nr:XRE family transcriptional regulator [Leucobacter edaphi]MBK0421751.1 cupin domain-containing protein [Leucobacter edaphi]
MHETPDPAEPSAEESLSALGPRLRAARHGRNWTLEELAERAGMSPSTLSRLESGKRQATLELLLPLTRLLGVSLDDLLAPTARDPRVRRAAIRKRGRTIAPLTREESATRAFKITFHPDAPQGDPRVHEGQEWLYVLSGRLRLTLGERETVLEPGEAAEFTTTIPHLMRAEGDRPAEVISIFNASGERMHVTGAE